MIIKSLSRKKPEFDQLIDYLGYFNKRDSVFGLTYNFYNDGDDKRGIIDDFKNNHKFLAPRSNGNALYHEIIALDPDFKGTRKKQILALRDIAKKYISLRAPNQLSYGIIHQDTPYLHMHLVISSNELMHSKRVRLSKKEFAQIQKDIEAYKIEKYPELGQTRYYDKSKSHNKSQQTSNEQSFVSRTGKPSHKQNMHDRLVDIFTQAQSRSEMDDALGKENLELYQRGRSVGVQTKGGRKYRLRTLGVMQNYLEATTRCDLTRGRLAELQTAKKQRHHQYEYER